MERFNIDIAKGKGIKKEIAIIIQTFNAVIPDGNGAYLAAPISSGIRLFELLAKTQCRSKEELIQQVGEETYLEKVRWPNVKEGEEFANKLRSRGINILINTGHIFINNWSDSDYMDMCFNLIKNKAKKVFFHPEWIFSGGAVKEFKFCMDNNIETLNVDSTPLTKSMANSTIKNAEKRLIDLGVMSETINEYIQKCRSLIL